MAKENVVKDDDFEPYGEVKVDSKNRITLGRSGAVKAFSYKVYRNSLGQFVLDPQVTIPAHEVWLFENKKALQSVKRGLDDLKHGRIKKAPEDFSKYINEK